MMWIEGYLKHIEILVKVELYDSKFCVTQCSFLRIVNILQRKVVT